MLTDLLPKLAFAFKQKQDNQFSGSELPASTEKQTNRRKGDPLAAAGVFEIVEGHPSRREEQQGYFTGSETGCANQEAKSFVWSRSPTGNAGTQTQVLPTLMPELFAMQARVHRPFSKTLLSKAAGSSICGCGMLLTAHRVLDWGLTQESSCLVCPRNVPPRGRPGIFSFSSPHAPALHRSHLTIPQAPCSLSPQRVGPAYGGGSGEKEKTKLKGRERGKQYHVVTLPLSGPVLHASPFSWATAPLQMGEGLNPARRATLEGAIPMGAFGFRMKFSAGP